MKLKCVLILGIVVLLKIYMTNSINIKSDPAHSISTTSVAPRSMILNCFIWKICVKPIRKQPKQDLKDLKVLESVLESYPRFRFIGKKYIYTNILLF